MTTGPADVGVPVKGGQGAVSVYGFGVHPWQSHLFYTGERVSKEEHYERVLEVSARYRDTEEYVRLVAELPEPRSLEQYIDEHFMPHRDLYRVIGEVGLDKQFRVKSTGGLSPCRVAVRHQAAVLERMLDLAVRYGKSVSLHDVQTHGVILDLVSKKLAGESGAIKVCLHSYTGAVDTLRIWLARFGEERVYVSLSYCINMSRKLEETCKILGQLPRRCILTETDYVIQSDKPEQSEDLDKVYKLLEEQWGVPVTQCESIIEDNYIRFIT